MPAMFEYAPSAPAPAMSLHLPYTSPNWARLLFLLVVIGMVTLAAGCPPAGDASRDLGGTADAGTDGHDGDADSGDAGDSDAGDSDAGDSDAGDSDAGDSDAGDSDAGDSDAGDSDAGDSDAGDSDAGDSDAGNAGDAGDANAGDGDGDAVGPEPGDGDGDGDGPAPGDGDGEGPDPNDGGGRLDRPEEEMARIQAIYDEMMDKYAEATAYDQRRGVEGFFLLLDRLKELAEEFIAEWGDDATADELGYPMQVFFEVCVIKKEWEDIFPKAEIVIGREMNSEIEPMSHYYKAIAMIELDYPEEDILFEVEQITEGDPRRAEILARLAGRTGKAVSSFSLPSLADAEVTYSSDDLIGSGQVTLIVFWNSPLQGSIDFLIHFVAKVWTEREGATNEAGETFTLLVVALELTEDGGENARGVVEREGFTFPIALDEPGEMSSSYGVSNMLPWLCYVGPDGKIIKRGFAHDLIEGVRADLEERFGPVEDEDGDEEGDGDGDEGGDEDDGDDEEGEGG